eukprot:c2793_g1_i1 orf=395-1384(-)
MARLGGMSTESFSSARERISAASTGLAGILGDQKVMYVSSRANVLLGLSSYTMPAGAHSLSNSPVRSLASSPRDSSGLLGTDDPDELKEEDIWAADMRESRNSQSLMEQLGLGHSASHGQDVWNHVYDPMMRHGYSHAYGIGSTHIHAHPHQHGHSRMHLDAPKQRMNAPDGTWPARHRVVDKGFGLTDAITTSVGSVRLSPLSKVSESQPPHTTVRQASTLSWTIPHTERCASHDASLRSEHQSAPVNVPNWSKILKQKANAVRNFDDVEEIGEEDKERLPPHELLAREYARSQRMTSSVCEGQGRTLKGRDMRRVRNAVWRQTGFAD